MLSLFNKKPKISKILVSTQKNIDIVFYLFESIKTKHEDFETMAYIKTPYYHSFGKLSQKQFEMFHKDFEFQQGEFVGQEPTMDELIKHRFPLHKSYEQAKSEKYRLNLAMIYTFYWPSNRESELTQEQKNRFLNFTLEDNLNRYDSEFNAATPEEQSTFLNRKTFAAEVMVEKYSFKKYLSIQSVLEGLQKYPIMELAYNDYNESIFDKKIEHSHRSLAHFAFVPGNFDDSLSQCKSITQLVNCILDIKKQQVNDSFKNQMTKYIASNIHQTTKDKDEVDYIYAFNQNLINRIMFVADYLNFSEYSFDQIVSLINRFDNNDYFFNESLFFPCKTLDGEPDDKYYFAFRKHLDFLKKQGFDLYKVFQHWNLYTSTMLNSSKFIEEVDFDLDPTRYKDLNRTYNYLGRRLSERLENFELKNYNGESFNNNISELSTITVDGYTLSVVVDFKQLFQAGIVLDNCAGSKTTLEYYKDKITYILSKDNSTKFMGCIKDGQFHQLKGYKNASPSLELFLNTYKLLQDLNFVDKIEKQHLKKRYIKQSKGDLWGALYEQECVQH